MSNIEQRRHMETSLINEGWLNILAIKKRELVQGKKSSRPRQLIAVFGGAMCEENSRLWKNIYNLGAKIAERNGVVINGAYGGVMEASAAGARSVDGVTIGVTCNNLSANEPNPYILYEWNLERWDQRLLALVWLSDGYAVMPGESGTLVELSMVIETQLKGFIPRRPIVCLGSFWKPVVDRIEGTEGMVTFERSVDRCAELLTS